MISKFLHFRPDHIAFPALTGLFMLSLANPQITQPGTWVIKPGMAGSAPMGTGNLDMTDMMDIKAMMRGMNKKMAATALAVCARLCHLCTEPRHAEP